MVDDFPKLRLRTRIGFRIRKQWGRLPWNQANAKCNQCGYRGIRRGRWRWCPACKDDLNGELIKTKGADRD